MAYGAGARYFFRQRERRFIGLSKRRTKFVFSDENGCHEDIVLSYCIVKKTGARGKSGAGWRRLRSRRWRGVADLVAGTHACTERLR